MVLGNNENLPPKATRSKKKKVAGPVDVGSTGLLAWPCRKCLKNRPLKDYYMATDPWDTSGHMSVCKYCIDVAFEKYYSIDRSLDKVILRLCKELNVKYDGIAVEATKKIVDKKESRGSLISGVFGIYRNALFNTGKAVNESRTEGEDFTYQGGYDYIPEDNLNKDLSNEDKEYLYNSWGRGLTSEDYEFLEESYSKWTKTTAVDNYGVEILLRELCHKENEIRKARLQNNSVDNLVKGLQEIMKNSALTPALQNAAATGKSADAFGVWIKNIENETPAEWFDDQDKYRDVEGIHEYNEKYITRSIKNFITGSRDFNVEETLGLDSGDLEDE